MHLISGLTVFNSNVTIGRFPPTKNTRVGFGTRKNLTNNNCDPEDDTIRSAADAM
jgi:hypothetical protein